MINIGDIKWATGFLEGEGSFRLTQCNSPVVSVNQVQKWPLKKINSIFPGRIIPVKGDGKNKQNSWMWYLKAKDSIQLMMTIFILISPKRKKTN